MKGTKQIAIRIANAEKDFLESIMNISKCTHDESLKVLAVYRKLKIIKTDPVIGRISVKHGVFLGSDIIQNAIKMHDEIIKNTC
jgi:hypothetical protein